MNDKAEDQVQMTCSSLDEQQDVERERCCLKCRYFEERTGFCRYNPPMPIVTVSHGQSFITSAYSKINMPAIDWCQKFDQK